ncbi:DgyrCDS1965 [Dimorphilus gyrociliatus]|uniref:DgyrCDS1965 n=1 Tax=Dimorphilus gyrociliatus TaxID=2664684 RepID=A0A7I8VDY3_9ANNE|nr:DgyrCDS1965 [Dimorphilus gyrociliatus]
MNPNYSFISNASMESSILDETDIFFGPVTEKEKNFRRKFEDKEQKLQDRRKERDPKDDVYFERRRVPLKDSQKPNMNESLEFSLIEAFGDKSISDVERTYESRRYSPSNALNDALDSSALENLLNNSQHDNNHKFTSMDDSFIDSRRPVSPFLFRNSGRGRFRSRAMVQLDFEEDKENDKPSPVKLKVASCQDLNRLGNIVKPIPIKASTQSVENLRKFEELSSAFKPISRSETNLTPKKESKFVDLRNEIVKQRSWNTNDVYKENRLFFDMNFIEDQYTYRQEMKERAEKDMSHLDLSIGPTNGIPSPILKNRPYQRIQVVTRVTQLNAAQSTKYGLSPAMKADERVTVRAARRKMVPHMNQMNTPTKASIRKFAPMSEPKKKADGVGHRFATPQTKRTCVMGSGANRSSKCRIPIRKTDSSTKDKESKKIRQPIWR